MGTLKQTIMMQVYENGIVSRIAWYAKMFNLKRNNMILFKSLRTHNAKKYSKC